MKKATSSLILICSFLSLIGKAQVTFLKTYGANELDYANSVQQTTDGGYIMVGSTESFGAGGQDVYLIKTDWVGNIVWTKTYGGPGHDEGYAVKQTTDNGYIVAGYTKTTLGGGGDYNVYIIKTDQAGDTLWTKIYGGVFGEWAEDIEFTSDGGYVIIGSTESYGTTGGWRNAYLIKIDSEGIAEWNSIYGGLENNSSENNVWATSVKQTQDGGYIISGTAEPFGLDYRNPFAVKINSTGDTLWTKTYSSPLNSNYQYSAVFTTSDSGFVFCGGWAFIIKTTASGELIWAKKYGGGGMLTNAIQTNDYGYLLIANYSRLLKIDSLGNIQWAVKYDMGDIHSVQPTDDGGYIGVGVTYELGDTMGNIFMVKMDSIGLNLCNGIPVDVLATDFFPVVGRTSSNLSNGLVEYSADNVIDEGGLSQIVCISDSINYTVHQLIIFPNPTYDIITIETDRNSGIYQVYNSIGQLLIQDSVPGLIFNLDLSTFSSGFYLINIIDGERVQNGKVVKQ
ncbi:MAG: hypothetical protein POELPBGB_00557 [Bacteroidia bacterium]|nr:hypothetical protein [Bacteroidia bacterium]